LECSQRSPSRRACELRQEEKAGREIFGARTSAYRAGYTYENENADFDDSRLQTFRRNNAAWTHFEAQPAGYRKKAIWWVMSAKRDESKDRRLAKLITASAANDRLE